MIEGENMCVLIGPDVIISNAFFAKQSEGDFLEISELQEFSSILYKRITGKNDSGVCYKYVSFQADRQDVDDFCRTNQGFIHGIDKIHCIKNVEFDDVKSINSKYAPEIQTMLQNARDDFQKRKR